eukprot:4149138-Prymnesium_polylepis.1
MNEKVTSQSCVKRLVDIQGGVECSRAVGGMSGWREPRALPPTMLPRPRPRSQRQWTPLHEAALGGHAEVVRALLAAGAEEGQGARRRGRQGGVGGDAGE